MSANTAKKNKKPPKATKIKTMRELSSAITIIPETKTLTIRKKRKFRQTRTGKKITRMLGANGQRITIKNSTIRLSPVLLMMSAFAYMTTRRRKRAAIMPFACMAIFFGVVSIYHVFILPYPVSDKPAVDANGKGGVGAVITSFGDSFATFFKKKYVVIAVLFMLLYRLPEAQLIKLIQPFLVDPQSVGGLGLSTTQVGVAYGTIGVIGLTIGGIIGGICASQGGLKKWIWPMALCISLNSIVYIALSYFEPDVNTLFGSLAIYTCVFIDQFGYGFGFTAFMLFMMYFADGPYKTSHYAICTAFMALGMMLPGMIAGWVQEQLGYNGFFWYVLCCTFATWGVTALVYPHIDPNYGRKNDAPSKVAEENITEDTEV